MAARRATPDHKAYWANGDDDVMRDLLCKHCGVPVVRNYDGPGTGWSHLFTGPCEGAKEC